MISFLAGICQNGMGVLHGLPQERATSIFKSDLPEFFSRFNIPHPMGVQNELKEAVRYVPSSILHYRPPNVTDLEVVAWKAVSNASVQLTDLIREALRLGMEDRAHALINVIIHTAEKYNVEYFKHLYLPFLRSMLPVWTENCLALSNTPFYSGNLYQCILGSYSRRYVGQKPSCLEKDWARIGVPCHCRDCGLLNHFITSPTERVGRFPMGKSRRQHLHQQLDMSRGSYTHITERLGNPQTLVVTKTRGEWDAKMRTWETRRAEAKNVFEAFGLENLRELLGNEFQNITGLLDKESRDERGAKRHQVGGAASSEYQRYFISPSRYTQNIDHTATVTGGAGTKRKLVEIIDLTGD
jgi:hypothetical protein